MCWKRRCGNWQSRNSLKVRGVSHRNDPPKMDYFMARFGENLAGSLRDGADRAEPVRDRAGELTDNVESIGKIGCGE